MDVGIQLARQPIEMMPEIAEQAEALGVHAVWTGEASHDGFVPLAVAMARTRRAVLGTNVIVAFGRSPTVTAHAAWDLQAMSHGRFVLGLGSQVKGHMERRFSVPWTPPVPKMREHVLALRSIWDCWQQGGKLAFQGKFYNLSFMPQAFSPPPMEYPPPPVYLAATNQGMCRLVGEVADGVLLNPVNTVLYLKEVVLRCIAEGAAKTGRDPKQVTIVANVFLAAGRNRSEVREQREALRRWVSFYSSPRSYSAVLALSGWQEISERLYKKSLEGDLDGMARACPDEMLDALAVIGEFDAIPHLLKQRFGDMVHQVVPFPLSILPENRELWRLLARELA